MDIWKAAKDIQSRIDAIENELYAMRQVLVDENRNPTTKERIDGRTLVAEIEELEEKLIRTPAIGNPLKPDPEMNYRSNNDHNNRSINKMENEFKSSGEYIAAVMQAGMPNGPVDSRLQRDVSGMSEGIPSDGGFLIGSDMGDIFDKLFETGSIASQCKRFTVKPGSNTLTLNAFDETSRADGSRLGEYTNAPC